MNNRNDIAFRSTITDFQRRGEPNFAWAKALSMFSLLPGLRGFWPMSNFDSSGNTYDLSGLGHTLTFNGNPYYKIQGLAPYIEFDGTGDYLSRADEADFDITGTETMIDTDLKGLTFGGWFFVSVVQSESLSPSASSSPSSSTSPSVSKSASVSPSISKSASQSPTISPSSSLSTSPSRSLSPSRSVSRSVSPSISPSASISISKSPSISPSSSKSSSLSPSASPSPSPAPPTPHVMALINKWDINTNNRSYILYYDHVSNHMVFSVTNLGTDASKKFIYGDPVVEEGAWYFVVGRFKPSMEMAIFVNNTKFASTDSIHASLYSGAASLIVGAKDEGTGSLLHGGASLNFVCASALPDGVIRGLYQHTRALFGL